jgi:hypothetical protein
MGMQMPKLHLCVLSCLANDGNTVTAFHDCSSEQKPPSSPAAHRLPVQGCIAHMMHPCDRKREKRSHQHALPFPLPQSLGKLSDVKKQKKSGMWL